MMSRRIQRNQRKKRLGNAFVHMACNSRMYRDARRVCFSEDEMEYRISLLQYRSIERATS